MSGRANDSSTLRGFGWVPYVLLGVAVAVAVAFGTLFALGAMRAKTPTRAVGVAVGGVGPARPAVPTAPSTTQDSPARTSDPAQSSKSASKPSKPAEQSAPQPGAVMTVATVVRVVDGDTAVFRLSDGSEEKVRFIGIDTPESTKTVEEYGKEASSYTRKVLTVGRSVVLEKDAESRDRYGRLLAYVWLSSPQVASDAEIRGKMFNAHLALGGYAQQMTIPPNVKYADYFRTYVAEARESGRGLWRTAPKQSRRITQPEEPDEPAAPKPTGGGSAGAPSASYIGNSNTMKFHHPECSSVPTIRPYHVVQLSSRASAVSQGYVPCGRCRP